MLGQNLVQSFRGSAAGREPGIHNHRSGSMDSELASASLRRPGMTRLTKIGTLEPHQLIFTPALWATFAHFSISAPMKVPNSAAVIDSGTTPCFAHDSLISVELRI